MSDEGMYYCGLCKHRHKYTSAKGRAHVEHADVASDAGAIVEEPGVEGSETSGEIFLGNDAGTSPGQYLARDGNVIKAVPSPEQTFDGGPPAMPTPEQIGEWARDDPKFAILLAGFQEQRSLIDGLVKTVSQWEGAAKPMDLQKLMQQLSENEVTRPILQAIPDMLKGLTGGSRYSAVGDRIQQRVEARVNRDIDRVIDSILGDAEVYIKEDEE